MKAINNQLNNKEVKMNKLNCWEYKKCGREAGGIKVHELGICPASVESKLDGIHGGKNAGRACWAVAGSMCGGKMQGSFAQKYGNCIICDFYRAVKEAEGSGYILSRRILDRLSDTLIKCGTGKK